jgi:hypothetical protein
MNRLREREISPVPGLSWNSCKHERVDSQDRQEGSHQFPGSHGTAANMKELSLRNGKRDLTSSWALMEQLQTKKNLSLWRGERDLTSSWDLMEQLKKEQAESREREREISPVPGLSWKICKHERVESMERQERSHQFPGSHGTAANVKELSLRNGKRDLNSFQALME